MIKFTAVSIVLYLTNLFMINAILKEKMKDMLYLDVARVLSAEVGTPIICRSFVSIVRI